MSRLVIILCSLLFNYTYGQELSPDSIKSIVKSYKIFLASGGDIDLSKRKILKIKSDLYKVEDRYPSGKLASIKYGNSIPMDIAFPELGLCTEFYENGKVKFTRNYMDSGTMVSEYFNNGSLFKEYYISLLGKISPLEVGDPSGNTLVKNGVGESLEVSEYFIVETGLYDKSLKSGIWRGYNEDGSLYYEENYNKEGLKSGKSYDIYGKSYSYKIIFERASFKGGESNLAKFLGDNIKVNYGNRYFNKTTQGKAPFIVDNSNVNYGQNIGVVPVEFVIDELGNVRDAISLTTENPILIYEALRLINSKSGKWLPAKQRGIPIKSDYKITINSK